MANMNKSKHQKKQTDASHKGNRQQDQNGFLRWAGIISILLLGVFIYSNSFDCSFQFDDKHNITDNAAIRDLAGVRTIWDLGPSRFVGYYSFALNYHFGQLNVRGYHIVNLLIHLINACLIYWVTRLLFRSPVLKGSTVARRQNTIAWLTALLFVSHPLATGAVTYIVQRLASLLTLFYLLSVGLYLTARLSASGRSYGYYAAAALSALLAIHTKENAYTLPLAIVLIELCFLQTKKIALNLKSPRILLGLLGVAVFLTIALTTFSFDVFNPLPPSKFNAETITSGNYFLTQLGVIVRYIRLLILPYNQNIDYDIPVSHSLLETTTLLSGLFLLSLLAVAIYVFNRNRIVSFGILWFFLALSVESGIIPISDLMFEHRTYLPSFGFYLIIAGALYPYLQDRNKNAAMLLLALMIGSNSVLAYQRNKVWKDELTLWSDAIKKSPDKPRPYMNRGYAYGRLQQWNNSIADFDKVNELNPEQHPQAYYNLGIAYWALGQKERSFDSYSHAISIDSNYADAYYGRGVCHYYLGDSAGALYDYTKALSITPRPDVYFNRGLLYANKKMYAEAINDYTQAISMTPDKAVLYNSRAVAYGNLGQWAKAVEDFTKTLELDPSNKSAYTNREYANSQLRKPTPQ
ncbi:MAG: hypothetical protein RL213_845 [Bacteroidota bacterium]|jgi:tetratricopeptide (TPR) repeat protein